MTKMMKQQRTYIAEVVRNKMDKTVIVTVKRTFVHPTYRKVVRGLTKLKAHDEQNACQIGDRVRIQQTRPLSKEKHWRVVEIVERSKGPALEVEEPS
jgi:small subunit ribosomal protein S17